MYEKLPWDDPLWTDCLEIQSIKPRLNGTISLMAISKTSENMTEEEIAGIRKLNSDKFHSNKVHGFPGVYYYFKMDTLGTPEIYAGKAGHLGRRAGRPDRLAEQDMVMAIRLNGIMNDEDIHMDDNWRQHLEHLMINDLKDRVDKFGIRIGNAKGEDPSLCFSNERKLIEEFFNLILDKLDSMQIPGFYNADIGKWVGSAKVGISLGNEKTRFEVAPNQGFILPSNQVKICKGARATAGRWSVDLAQQRLKTELIENSTLEACRWSKKGNPTSYRFTNDVIFPTITWATRIITNRNDGWDAAGWIKNE